MATYATTPCRHCGRPVIIRRRMWNAAAQRWIQGNPFLVFHPDGLPCCGSSGQMHLNL